MTVRAYLGLGSRYSYLASTQLARISKSHGVEIDWIPVNSVELIRRARPDGSPFEAPSLAGQYDPAFRSEDAARWARYYGVRFVEPQPSSLPANALALACWCQPDRQLRQALMTEIFTRIFCDGAAMDLQTLVSLGQPFSVGRAQLDEALSGGQAHELHEDAIAQALRAGVFGVPSFVVDEQVFWGNDRLPLLEHHLAQGRNAS